MAKSFEELGENVGRQVSQLEHARDGDKSSDADGPIFSWSVVKTV
jgi:hypothetical protein